MVRSDNLLVVEPFDGAQNPYLKGNFAPVSQELDASDGLTVEGSIPKDLEGMLVRNGPNPSSVSDPTTYHWFEGDGMVHAVELLDSKAVSYRRRWVRTRRLASTLKTRPPHGPLEPLDGSANVNVIAHAGRILALSEISLPLTLTSEMGTVGVEDFDTMLASPMTAHPKVDPDTGALVFFGYDCLGPPYLRYHEADRHGSLIHTAELDIPRVTMMHDFGVTATRIAFLDLPVVFDPHLAAGGRSFPFRFDPEAGARVGVMDRGAGGRSVQWTTIDPSYVLHVMNAFDDGPAVVLDVCCYQRTFDTEPGGLLGSTLPSLYRWRLNTTEGTFAVSQLDDRTIEFPRVDTALSGRPYRYGYCVAVSQDDTSQSFDALIQYDLERHQVRRYDPGPGRSPSEPVFVRAADGHADNEGWVLSVVYDATSGLSDMVILDASSFGSPPVAVIHLPDRVPFGLHGAWIPISEYR